MRDEGSLSLAGRRQCIEGDTGRANALIDAG